MRSNQVFKLSLTGLLCAMGIIIPIVSPFKIVLEPASFTLASHVAIMVAMFISPITALIVTIVSSAGFLFAGYFPIIVVLRSLSHIVFAYLGAIYLRKHSIEKVKWLFSIIIALIHSICELIIVSIFYFGIGVNDSYYDKGFFMSVVLLVGFGTIVHSMIDFEIALVIWKIINKNNKKIN